MTLKEIIIDSTTLFMLLLLLTHACTWVHDFIHYDIKKWKWDKEILRNSVAITIIYMIISLIFLVYKRVI